MPEDALHGFSGADAAALMNAGAKPRQVRDILAAYPDMGSYVGADDHVERGVVSVEPIPVEYDEGWVLVLGGAGYPAHLAAAPAPPVVLFGRGDPSVLRPGVAVVGTREVSALGEAAARAAVEGAAAAGAPVHSGLARGCDAAGHRAALDVGVPTVAVIASGVDLLTPRGNAALGERILAAGGAVVSELLPGTPVRPQQLMARNRIVAGLSSVLVVCEASLSSGTMGAVRNMLAAGRVVLVPAPKEAGRKLPGAEALLALGDPAGVDPAVLGVKGALAEQVRGMRPVARVGSDRAMLKRLVVEAHEEWVRENRQDVT